MCGIAGVIGPFAPEQAKAWLSSMLTVQRHRGPDDQGAEIMRCGQNVIGLGNLRLAIVDLSPLGHQPMTNPDTGDVLVYNGEIYNAVELRGELESAGIRFRGRSDTEVLMRALERYGAECLDRLRGMFAMAFWDARRQRVLLSRDPLGIKPLYVSSERSRGTVFASEIRALVASGLVRTEVDRRGLAGYLAYGAVQEPLTMLADVRSLEPGSRAWVDPDGRREASVRHWHFPDRTANRKHASEVVEEGRHLLGQAVRRHLISDVPIGVFLSSGLDSTAVLGLATRASTDPVHSFTVALPGASGMDEGVVAARTSKRLGSLHHEIPVTSDQAMRWTQHALAAMDQPTMDGMNTYIVSRAVREAGLVVALTGQGGDEVFGGYRSFRFVPEASSLLGRVSFLPPRLRARIAWAVAIRRGSVARSKAAEMATAGSDLHRLYFKFRQLLSDREMASLGYSASATGLSPTYHVPDGDRGRLEVPGQPARTVGRLETSYYLGNTLLRDADVFGMANSIEIRPPLLDRDLVDWVFSLDEQTLLPSGRAGKHLLREACRGFFDQAQLDSPKRGFQLPISEWMMGPLRDRVQDSLDVLRSTRLVLPAGIEMVQRSFLADPAGSAWSRTWALVTLGHWLHTLKGMQAGAIR